MGEVTDQSVDDYRVLARIFAAAAHADDVDAYNLIQSGADSPNAAGKYFSALVFDPITGSFKTKGEKQAEETLRTLRWLMANDPVYAQAMVSTKQVFVDVLDKAAILIDRLTEARLQFSDSLSELRGKAPTLEDGRTVYRDAQGRVRDEEGNVIPDALAAHIEWNGNEPSYEEFRALQDQIDAINAAINEARGIEAEAGRLQGELTNPDTPPQTVDDVERYEYQGKDFSGKLDELETVIPQVHSAQMAGPEEMPSPPAAASASAKLPKALR